MQLTVILILCLPVLGLASQRSEIRPLGPIQSVYQTLYLTNAVADFNQARRLEAAGQYQPALATYTRVIQQAQSAAQANPGGTQDPSIHYVLGLANADSARMLQRLQVSHLFRDNYWVYLQNAEQNLNMSLEMYSQRGLAAWPITAELSTVHILQGNLTSAQSELQTLQLETPSYLPAREATQRFNNGAASVRTIAAAIQAKISAVTPAQWSALEQFAKTVLLALMPTQAKAIATTVTVASAGVTLFQQWQATAVTQ